MKRIVLLCLLAWSAMAHAQSADTTSRKGNWIGVPVLFRLPETGWGAGAAVMHTRFLGHPSTTPPSQIQFGFAYTQNKQLLVYLPFQLYAADDRWRAKGEVGYYRYSYFYYGRGNELQDPDGERFYVTFPRLRLDWLLPLNTEGHFAGVRYWYEDYRVDTDRYTPGGYFDTGLVPGGTGSTVSGLGGVYLMDHRDHVMQPKQGWYAEASYQHFSQALGGSSGFDRYRLDVRGYRNLKDTHTLASRLWLEYGTGDVPFQQLALMGGSRRMRGFYEGRFRDRNALIWQGEYRLDIRELWGVVAFASLGMVAIEPRDFALKHLRYTYGVGARFELDQASRLNLRFDVGVGEGRLQTYFTFGEAF
ncbi:MAG: BamA/TamA family outer membrane protein [Flavobacteriales bacterium]